MAKKPTYKELEQRVKELEAEAAQRKEAEEALLKVHDELEQRVEERTAELSKANDQLKRKMEEFKQAGKAIQKERDRSQKYLDVAKVVFVVIGRDQKVNLINKKGCEVLGYDEKEIIGKNWFDNFLPKKNIKSVKSVFGKLTAGEIESIEYFENHVLTKSGEERIIAWKNTILYDDQGNIDCFLSSGEDITKSKQAEEALQESEEKFRSLFNDALDMIHIVDANGNIIDVNRNHGLYQRRVHRKTYS